MRGKRSRKYRKLMQQYELHFGFREPYQVLVDAEILREAARCRMDFAGGLKKALHGEVKLMITQCCIRHLYTSLPSDHPLIAHAKGLERRRCNHHELESPLSALECLREVVDPKGSGTNKHRYVVATQEENVLEHMRKIPGVPLVFITRSVMILDRITASTEQVREREERAKFRAGIKGSRGGPVAGVKRKREDADESVAQQPKDVESDRQVVKKKRKRGPKEPNPLSNKKPKPKDVANKTANGTNVAGEDSSVAAAKRKRKRQHKSRSDSSLGLGLGLTAESPNGT